MSQDTASSDREAARLTVLSGPSGVGKGSVIGVVRRRHPDVWLSVSVTTRAPRPGEVDGVQYHFVSQDEFARMAASGELLEHASYAGNSYGTPRAPVEERLASGLPALLEIELQGARQIRTRAPHARQVFVRPPSLDALRARLVGRGADPQEQVERRLETARVELAAEGEFEHVVCNDRLEDAVQELLDLVATIWAQPDAGATPT